MKTSRKRRQQNKKKKKTKLKNNAIFGKTIRNPMSKVDVKLVISRKKYLMWSFRQTFKREKQFRNGAIFIEKEKCRANLNKPTYTGTNILDLSKVLTQGFHYNYNSTNMVIKLNCC